MSKGLHELYIVPRVAMTRAQVVALITHAFHCMNNEHSGLVAGNNNNVDAELKEVLTWIKRRRAGIEIRPGAPNDFSRLRCLAPQIRLGKG